MKEQMQYQKWIEWPQFMFSAVSALSITPSAPPIGSFGSKSQNLLQALMHFRGSINYTFNLNRQEST